LHVALPLSDFIKNFQTKDCFILGTVKTCFYLFIFILKACLKQNANNEKRYSTCEININEKERRNKERKEERKEKYN